MDSMICHICLTTDDVKVKIDKLDLCTKCYDDVQVIISEMESKNGKN